jgi:hypothetical protein
MMRGKLVRGSSWVLVASMLANAACGPRTYAEYPHLDLIRVCINPPIVEPDARHWAYDEDTDTTVSGNDEEAYENFLPNADKVFIRDFNAPAESVERLPPPYNELSCDAGRILPRAVEGFGFLPSGDANPLRTTPSIDLRTELKDVSPRHRHVLAIDERKPTRKVPVFFVCVRPPGVSNDAKQWAATQDLPGKTYTQDEAQFNTLAATAERIFVFDENAPPESVYAFGPPHDELRCPGKPPPKPRSQVSLNIEERRALLDKLVAQAASEAFGPEKAGLGGSPKPTWSSSETGKGKPLSLFESVVRQTLIAQGILSGDVDGSLKDPNGSRYGLPNGKNPGGPDSLFLQFTAAGFGFVPTVIKSTAHFIKTVAKFAKKNAVAIIADPKYLPKAIAEGLVRDYGYKLAPSLNELKTILPYSRAEMFTANWRHLFQAHHILEVDMMEKVFKQSAEHVPAIILTKAEHKIITDALNSARNEVLRQTGKKVAAQLTPDELWRIYQMAYGQKHPIWLEAIKSYFGK